MIWFVYFFLQAEDFIRDVAVTGVQTCALPICGMVFGDVGSTKRWTRDPRVEVHGPGYSKVVVGPDAADDWRSHVDTIARSEERRVGKCVDLGGLRWSRLVMKYVSKTGINECVT